MSAGRFLNINSSSGWYGEPLLQPPSTLQFCPTCIKLFINRGFTSMGLNSRVVGNSLICLHIPSYNQNLLRLVQLRKIVLVVF